MAQVKKINLEMEGKSVVPQFSTAIVEIDDKGQETIVFVTGSDYALIQDADLITKVENRLKTYEFEFQELKYLRTELQEDGRSIIDWMFRSSKEYSLGIRVTNSYVGKLNVTIRPTLWIGQKVYCLTDVLKTHNFKHTYGNANSFKIDFAIDDLISNLPVFEAKMKKVWNTLKEKDVIEDWRKDVQASCELLGFTSKVKVLTEKLSKLVAAGDPLNELSLYKAAVELIWESNLPLETKISHETKIIKFLL